MCSSSRNLFSNGPGLVMVTATQNIRFSVVIDDIRSIVSGAWRYRWKGIGLAWMICLSGWFFVLSLPNIYEASSRLFIDTSSTLGEVLKGDVVPSDTVSEANIMVRSITSRPSLESIASRTGILVGGESPSEVEAIIQRMQSEIEISLDIRQVLEATYQHANSDIALAVVSQLFDSFIEGLLLVNRSDSDVAQEFLSEQLAEYEGLLLQAENRLADFKKENLGQMPGQRGDYFARFQEEQEVLNNLNFELRLGREQQAELSRKIAGETPVFGLVRPDEEMTNLDTAIGRQIQEFETELALLRIQYTDSHPDIVRINAILDDLRGQQEEERVIIGGSGGGSLEENPVNQSMRIQLSKVELEVIALQSKRANQAMLVKDLRDKIDVIPDIEAELTRLNRDYDVNNTQYDALLVRLETARMTEAAEQSKTQYEFRIIDPPVVSPSPVGPNRVLFMTAVFILSLGIGLVLTIFLSFTQPVFFSVRSLEKRFGVPVLGGLRYVSSESDIVAARSNLFVFVTCFVGLFSLYGMVIMLNQTGAKFINGLIATLGSIT